MKRHHLAVIGVGTTLALIVGVATPVWATEPSTATSEIEAVLPAVAAETDVAAGVAVTDTATLTAVEVDPSAALLESVDAANEEFAVADEEVEEVIPVSLAVEVDSDYVEAAITGDELTTFEGTGEADGSDIAVQPTDWGFRLIAVIDSASSPTSYSYRFQLPADAQYVAENGGYTVTSETLNGTIQAPWAFDAAGNEVATSYDFDGRTLVQHVDLSDPGITYPVVADPAWSYSRVYTLGVTTGTVESRLRSCFNCYFPIAGAPARFPSVGQALPLRVCFNAAALCGAAPVKVTRVSSQVTPRRLFSFAFAATAGHFDGAGSTISFAFGDVGTTARLTVNAYVLIDRGAAINAVNTAGASSNWAQFARNLSIKY